MKTSLISFDQAFTALPLVAILRGIRPEEVQAIAMGLYETGFRIIEVPLNSPSALESISLLSRSLPEDALCGAGTVLSADAVRQVHEAGGRLIVMPHADTQVISEAKAQGLYCVPGVCTLTEAFAALHAGADAVKLFPAELITPPIVSAMRAVLPATLRLLPVGGITPDNMQAYLQAGVSGFGLGSALYKPGMDSMAVQQQARRFVAAIRTQSQGSTSA
ncbi:2-dehydro-3-deoxy-6-phosphogalactonate aldolase [Undibacterium sp. Di26W]|uniref:2-dehydro-3-deoxy-6-phosphogalactonate aldolase n=1 Tax=Undibacterium sp. Di26W TaxID=3413035 RepID=UPI003BF2B227